MSNKKILALTGITGFKTGSVLVDKISQNSGQINSMYPDGIRAIVRNTSDVSSIVDRIPFIDVKRGSFDDIDFLSAGLENVDTVVHIAGIQLSRQIVRAAINCKVRRIVLVHTTGMYSKYKAAGEVYREIENDVIELCKENDIIYTILRPTMIYGNKYDNNMIQFIHMIDKFPIMPIVNQAQYELQPVHYEDVGIAYYQVLVNEENTANKCFNLSGEKPISLRDIFLLIGSSLNKKMRFFSVPFCIAYSGAIIIYFLSFGRCDYREKVQRLCEPRVFSHEEATRAFNFSSRRFEEGIKTEVAEYQYM